MSKSKDCCDSCRRGQECEDTPLCRTFAVEPTVLPPTFRIEPGEPKNAPAGAVTRALYKPPERAGYRTLLESFGFAAPIVDPPAVGVYAPTYCAVWFVPRDTSDIPGDPKFAGLSVQRQVLLDDVVPFWTVNAEGRGLKIPTDDSGRSWWVYVQIGRRGELPTTACSFNISFAADRALWSFDC